MTNQRIFLLGDAQIEPLRGIIRVGTDERYIEPQTMAVLIHLCQHPGQVVTRDALLAAVWEGTVVNDGAISKAICLLRKALGDQAKHPRYIETISKVGYRLVAPISRASASSRHYTGTQHHANPHGTGDRPGIKQPRRYRYIHTALKYVAIAGVFGLLYSMRPTTIEIEQDITYFPTAQHGTLAVDSSRVSVDSVWVNEEVHVYQLSAIEMEGSP